MLSTLHQSSLGMMYLIMAGKLHALWYSPILPLLFFVSAVAVGLAMVIVESKLSSRAFGRSLELPILTTMGRALVGALGLYGFIRIFDLYSRGVLGEAFTFSYESTMFLIEFVLGVILPIVILASARRRRSEKWLYTGGLLAVMGFVVNRMNVSLTGFEGAQGGHYIPSWAEVMITLMIVAIGFGAFSFIVKHFPVYPEEEEKPEVAAGIPEEVEVTAPWERVLLDR